jgi:type I restriction enzyme S subunit
VDNSQKISRNASKPFTPYPKYKDSGVEWLGIVPASWQICATKRRFDIFLGKMLQPELAFANDLQVPYLKAASVQWESVSLSSLQTMWASQNEIQTGQVAVGDLLVCEGGEVGRAAILTQAPEEPTIIQNALHRVRSHSEIVKFLMYLLEISASRGWLEVECNKATIQHFTRDKFGSLGIALPSHEEQLQIVSFLDRETTKIDALIEKKDRLIELLQEKRTALITQAVTKGLDPTVPIKDSGIEWLGKIPAHWDVLRLKYLSSINDEILNEKTDPRFELSYVDIGGIDQYQGIVASEELVFESAPSRARRIVRDGDVIISTVRTYLRAIAPIKHPESNLIVSTGFAVIRPSSALESNFAPYALRASHFIESVVANSVGVSYPAIDASKMSCFLIATPGIEEQQGIAAFLDRETAKIDALVAKIHEAIDRLKEYRTTLISAAVTGKIDVQYRIT